MNTSLDKAVEKGKAEWRSEDTGLTSARQLEDKRTDPDTRFEGRGQRLWPVSSFFP